MPRLKVAARPAPSPLAGEAPGARDCPLPRLSPVHRLAGARPQQHRADPALHGAHRGCTRPRASERRPRARPQWVEDVALLAEVKTALTFGRSPDQIAGRLRRERRAGTVSHETIYAYVRRDAASGGELWTFLRYKGWKQSWRVPLSTIIQFSPEGFQ